MADDKARLAAARKKAQKKAAEAKAKKEKAAASKDEDAGEAAAAAADATDEAKEETPAADEGALPSPPAEPEAEASAAAPEAAGGSTAALEARLVELEKECAEAKSARDEAQLMADALEKKVASLEMLHTEDEGQVRRLELDLAEARSQGEDLRGKLQKAEAENLRLSKKEARDGGGTDNDHLDELEDEERQGLEKRIRELEAENTDLKREIWQERRKNLQPGMDEAGGVSGSGSGHFTNVDLGGSTSPGAQRKQQAGGGFGDFFTSGLSALTGAGGQQGHGQGLEHDDDGFLDDDEEFDEEAFRKAQEEAAKARIERIKEVKRGLKNWEGWRLDLVEGRQGGGEGIGEIFEV